eukprot:CAMPEP_0202869150 /NCGR_PEP_ID=MMETSP1391-20130828/11978_1 /ASSEMBLY_ACC=CAM_ASM_000867 /TAXON_ID=1034604 /ORGANISM="Chlamydomonas leiostraca, Strain SAG 11-49" /LENGTH=142 /DNA_ID=CAMNT_0049549415 /DNA_START=85 /DNA_END=513 /DNA_ORIENTATION=+
MKAGPSGRPSTVSVRSIASSVTLAPAPTSSWAIVRIAGVGQYVEEGRTLALKTLPANAKKLGKKVVQFTDVLAFKGHGDQLRRARNGVLQDVVVEGSIEEEFQAPHGAGPEPVTLSKVVITAIRKAGPQGSHPVSSDASEQN